jgi:ribonuclease BN (tRNA processing enzyme)
LVKVTILGCGDAFGAGGRMHSSYLVETPERTFLVDCGPTILQALKRLRLDPGRIDFILLSHLHGDHFGGLPFLYMEYRYEAPRSRPLAVYGPSGTAERTQRLFEALYEKTALEPMSFPLEYEELTGGTEKTVGDVRIRPFAVPHVSELSCLGYRLEADGRAIVYSGDSAWSDEFITQARGADLFLCECSTFEPNVPIHISYREISARAAEIDCRRLVLTHLGAEPLRRQREISLECARDGMTLELAEPRRVSRRVHSVVPRSDVRRQPKGASRGRARRRR